MSLPKLFVANDASTWQKALDNLRMIDGVKGDYGIKLNLDLILKNLDNIAFFQSFFQRPLFIDLKMWNGARTMSEVFKAVADQGATMVNVYALADSMLDKAIKVAKEAKLIVLGVTVLTHYNEAYCQKFFKRSLDETVRLLAETALQRGCDGYILPGTTLDAVSDLGGIKFNPAVRPAWFEDKKANLQEQIMTPSDALRKGSSIVSCGSPIFKSPDPKEALRQILAEIESI